MTGTRRTGRAVGQLAVMACLVAIGLGCQSDKGADKSSKSAGKTSGQITRILSTGIFRTFWHRISRSRWLPWLPTVRVRWSRLASYSQTTARVSIKLVTMRGLTIDISATAWAFAKAASAAALSPIETSNSTLPA